MTYIGKSVKRVEDKRFLTGKGRYTDDIVLPGMAHAYIIRSPYAHASIDKIDAGAALDMDGVLAVYTGKDLDNVNGVPCGWQVNFKNGDTMKEPKHPILASGKALHMGDGVAVVIAESRDIARDAANLVEIEYTELDAVANAFEATRASLMARLSARENRTVKRQECLP